MSHAIAWFDIPVADLPRATKFYEKILGKKLVPNNSAAEGPRKTVFFPADWSKGEIGGCLVQGKGLEPSGKGTVAYLDCGEDLLPVEKRVEKAGGKVLQPKTAIPMEGAGFMGMIVDSEGNTVGLWSPK